MNFIKNFIKHIEEKQFKNLYLVFGEEEYLKNICEKQFLEAIVPENIAMMNFDIFEGKNISLSHIFDASDTAPFMNDFRLIYVKNSYLFAEGKKEETEKMVEYINKIPSSTIIVFFEEKVDKRLKIFKEVKKTGIIFEFSTLRENELAQWVIQEFIKNGKKISLQNSVYLIRNVGFSMEIIYNEINKLVSYKKDELEIDKNDIDSICTKSLESKVFDLVDSIGYKNVSKAIDIYKNLIFNKISPFMILAMIVRQFRIILQAKYLKKSGENLQDIARQMGIRDFIVREAVNQGCNFTNKILLEGIKECLETDNKIKTGIIQDELAVEMLIIKYAGSKE